jgi:hypothetical protein
LEWWYCGVGAGEWWVYMPVRRAARRNWPLGARRRRRARGGGQRLVWWVGSGGRREGSVGGSTGKRRETLLD